MCRQDDAALGMPQKGNPAQRPDSHVAEMDHFRRFGEQQASPGFYSESDQGTSRRDSTIGIARKGNDIQAMRPAQFAGQTNAIGFHPPDGRCPFACNEPHVGVN